MAQNHDPKFEENAYPQVADSNVLEGLRSLRSTVIGLLSAMADKEAVYVGKEE